MCFKGVAFSPATYTFQKTAGQMIKSAQMTISMGRAVFAAPALGIHALPCKPIDTQEKMGFISLHEYKCISQLHISSEGGAMLTAIY